jgi:hypothetical protein
LNGGTPDLSVLVGGAFRFERWRARVGISKAETAFPVAFKANADQSRAIPGVVSLGVAVVTPGRDSGCYPFAVAALDLPSRARPGKARRVLRLAKREAYEDG